jgi:putative ABC transport system permease protein
LLVTAGRVLRIARQRLRAIARPRRLDAELEQELALHIDQLVRENIAAGMPQSEARLAARRTLGNAAALAERCRDERRVNWFQDLRLDVVYGLRMLRKNAAFTTVVVMSLALGIGANTAVIGVADAIRRDAVPLPDADRLVTIRRARLDNPAETSGSSVRDYLTWTARARTFDALEISLSAPRDLGAEEPAIAAERITGLSVSRGLLPALGIRPLKGRLFDETDAPANAEPAPVVVISWRLWQTRYGSDPDILNRQIRVDKVPRTIVGVMPRDVEYIFPRADCWVPMRIDSDQQSGTARFFSITGRLKPGVSLAQAQGDLSAIAAQLASEVPDHNRGLGVQVMLLRDALYGWTKEPLATLGAAGALVLFVACANVAGLLLSRTAARQREVAMRFAIGAGRARIIRQLLTESVLLSCAGGAFGLIVAWCGIRGLVAMSPPFSSPPIADVSLSVRMLAITGALSMLTGVAFGLAPAWIASQTNPIGPIKDAEASSGADRRQLARTGLVAAQLAMAVILLSAAGLLVKSFVRLTGRELNFDPVGLLTFEARTAVTQRPLGLLNGFGYFQIESEPAQAFSDIYDRLRALPGVESAAGISYVHVDSLLLPVMDVAVGGTGSADRNRRGLRAVYFLVTPNLFRTMRTPLLQGRDIDESDTRARPWVAVVNQAAARLFWPSLDPIGRRLTIDIVPEEQTREVVGVVPDIPVRHGETTAQPVIYASYRQQPSRYRGPFGGMFGQMTFMLRGPSDPSTLVPGARRAVAEIEPNRPISAIFTAAQRLRIGMVRRRYYAFLVSLLAVVAAMLSAIGVYGVMAYSIGQRTREIGIRKALGAGTPQIVALVGRRALALGAVGLLAGSGAALLLSRLLVSQLWGITPTDPATYATVALLLMAVTVLACLGPIRRAIGVDPAVALRCE